MNSEILERLKSNLKTQAARPELTPALQASPSKKRSPLYLPLFFLLGLIVLAVAGWSAVNRPVLAEIVKINATATPSSSAQPFWAQALIAKPVYTPTVMPAPTSAPQSSATPGLITAEIVPDTPMPAYTASNSPAQAAPVGSYGGSKYILVDISEQHLYAYENDALVFSFVASTGLNNATRTGHFAVQSKIPNAYGATWNIWMPHWLGIYYSGGLENGIHALPILSNGSVLWAGFLGRPISYGCIVLGSYEAESLYDWADYGTPVEIQW